MKQYNKTFIIYIAVLLITLFISANLYQVTLVQGNSMVPSYKNMQLAIIDKRAKTFQCGDVIAFYCPALDCIMIKRIIAVSGDSILITNGDVLVNGVKSPYICGTVNFAGTASKELILGDNQFFVMGDNYAPSKDSRYEEIGCIHLEHILGLLIPNRSIRHGNNSGQNVVLL